MKKEIVFKIDNDINEKFNLALSLTQDDQNTAIENCMKWYISKSFEQASQTYSPSSKLKNPNGDELNYGKANRRIPNWAQKPKQYNHKIIRSFFLSEELYEIPTIETMEKLCSDKMESALYVPTFKSNYAQMKIDAPQSHGKVFEDDGDRVWIWDEVKDTLMQYKEYFL